MSTSTKKDHRMNIKYTCSETNQRYFVRTRSDGLFDITERYTDKDDVTYMWDCIPETFVEDL